MSGDRLADRYEAMSSVELAGLVIDQLKDEPHGEHDDDCPFCAAVCAVNELVSRVARLDSGAAE